MSKLVMSIMFIIFLCECLMCFTDGYLFPNGETKLASKMEEESAFHRVEEKKLSTNTVCEL